MNSRDVITVVGAETPGRNAEPITERGFVFMDTPGYDPVGAPPDRSPAAAT